MKKPALIKFLLIAFLLPFLGGVGGGCTSDELNGPLPQIIWTMSSGRFRVMAGETLTLVPDIENADETTIYRWTVDGVVVSSADHLTFVREQEGEYYVALTVTNHFGQTMDEVKITVLAREDDELPEIPASGGWRFPWTVINMAEGRTIKVKAYMTDADATYSWMLDGAEVAGRTDEVAYVFTASSLGQHTLTLIQEDADGTAERTQQFTINVCPPEGTFRRPSEGDAMVNKIYEYMPAPGHQVNGYILVGDSYPAGCTHEEACDSVQAHFSRRWSVSLGAQGGYLIAGFDHSVPSSPSDYELCVKGNPFSYQSEPGIIWVSQDDNGDGLPNDQWFELAGSEYGTDNETLEYAITYYRPEKARSATGWRDCTGATGYVPYMSYWNPHDYYWQPWVEGTEHTYFGSRLRDRSTYEGGMSDIPPYDWGYVDNLGDLLDGPAGRMGYYKISNARTWDGKPANLQYIDFVKIQTAQTGSTPNLGEISTEVYYIGAPM